MKLRANLSERAIVHGSQEPWVPSPSSGVDRCMLERDGDEVARATTIVRFAPNSKFPRHTHGGGEEFVVLEGVFSDEADNYPSGCYVRHPIGSTHEPWTDGGCLLLVKLRQMTDTTEKTVVIDTNSATWDQLDANRKYLMLFENPNTGETVWMEKWAPETSLEWIVGKGGEELFVLDGDLSDQLGGNAKQSDVLMILRPYLVKPSASFAFVDANFPWQATLFKCKYPYGPP